MDPMTHVIQVYHEKHREAAQLLARPAFLTFQRGENSFGEASKGPGNWSLGSLNGSHFGDIKQFTKCMANLN